MLSQLQKLIDLQDICRRIQILEDESVRLPKEIERMEHARARAQREVEQFKAEIEEMEKRRRSMEREADQARGELTKKRYKLHEVKSNKEYAAMQAEIAHSEQQISDKEDEVLQVLMEIDERDEEYRRRTEELAELERRFRTEQTEKRERLERAQRDLEELRARRKDLSAEIEESLLTLYGNVYELRKGLAVVRVVNGTCQGCHMTLPPQVVSEVKQNDCIITCGECDRILYFQEE